MVELSLEHINTRWAIFAAIVAILVGVISIIPESVKLSNTPNWITIIMGVGQILLFFYIVLFYEKRK